MTDRPTPQDDERWAKTLAATDAHNSMPGLTLGEQVRQARDSLGLRELGRRVGITPSYLSDIEHDRRRPSEATWKALVLAIDDMMPRERPDAMPTVEWDIAVAGWQAARSRLDAAVALLSSKEDGS